jgi:hypothetical protein
VVGRNYEKTLEKCKKFDIPNVFDSIEKIPIHECDFLMNLTSADAISSTLKQIISFKKPIFTEKPVGFGIKEIQELINQNKKFNSNIMVGTNRRFYSIFHQALQFLKEHDKKIESIKIDAPERFSDINQEKFNSKIKENWMFANSIHCIDLIRFFGGDIKKIESIYAKYKYICYSTASSKVEHPKFRLVFPLTRWIDKVEIKNFWLDSTKGINPNKKQEPVVFIVVYPKKLEWDFASEKQLQTTLLQTSGGVTGAGTGHNQKICYLTELNDVLETCDKYTHAMIVSVGMVFDMVCRTTAIQRFYDWTKTGEFCRGHIIARPNEKAFLHHQHIELNLQKCRNFFDSFVCFPLKNSKAHCFFFCNFLELETDN